MDIVSFETAKRLEKAGFPQPSVCEGQYWYKHKSKVLFCRYQYADAAKMDVIGNPTSFIEWEYDAFKNLIFAPTATDILRLLRSDIVFSHWLEHTGIYFQVRIFKKGGNEVQYFHENPAEACAMAWLAQNERK